MPLQEITCSSCGTRCAEYDPNKWKCLNPRCNSTFVYETPAKKTVHHIEHHDENLYNCANCTGTFNVISIPHFACQECGNKKFCQSCYNEIKVCKECQEERLARKKNQQMKAAKSFFSIAGPLAIGVILVLIVVSLPNYLLQRSYGFSWKTSLFNRVYVTNVSSRDTPAKAAGIREGDRIRAVSGHKLLKGDFIKTCRLHTILRKAKNNSETLLIHLTRDGEKFACNLESP